MERYVMSRPQAEALAVTLRKRRRRPSKLDPNPVR
jgi:hypothetical protein